jgi:hypothetical protein
MAGIMVGITAGITAGITRKDIMAKGIMALIMVEATGTCSTQTTPIIISHPLGIPRH